MTSAEANWDLPREQAIPRLVDAQGGRLYGLARRLCGTPEEAEDLVQEVFLQAFRKWEQFEGRSQPITWLYTIAARICQRMHRRRAGEPERLASLDELLPFGDPKVADLDTDSVLTEVQRREARELVGAAITTLDDDFRMPLVLKDIVGLSVLEVADVLDLKEATVKTRLHRARLKLRQVLEGALPRRDAPPPAYSRQVCLDLLESKQNALDRGVPFPVGNEVVCERCRSVFATMDATGEVCAEFGDGQLPPRLRATLLQAMDER